MSLSLAAVTLRYENHFGEGQSEPMAPLDRFCSSLGVCDADFSQM